MEISQSSQPFKKQNKSKQKNQYKTQQKYTADQYQWKPLLEEHHKMNIPIYHEKQDGIVHQILTVNIPKNLYVQKQYKRLNDHIIYYIKQFQKYCHISIDKDDFHFSALESYQKEIRLGLQEISEQLAFLNLRPFADIVKKFSLFLSRNHSNFINFIKMNKRSRFTLFQNKTQCKNDFKSYCLDCKTHRQQIIIKELKRKLNLNKIEEVVIFQEYIGVGDQISKKIQAQVDRNYNRVKMSIKETMQKQQRRQEFVKQNKVKSQLKNQIYQQEDILIMEKQNYIEQVNALLAGRETNLAGNTQTYSYLVNQLMNFPVDKFNSKTEEEVLIQTQKLAQKIKKQLFDNFLSTLSEPIKQVFKKLIKKNDFNQIHGLDIPEKIIKCDVETQTSKATQQKIQFLERMIQKKNHQLSSIKGTNQQLQKKYMEKYEQLRQQQKDSHAKHKEIKRCYRQIQSLEQKINELTYKLELQEISKQKQLKQFQMIHQNQIKQLKKQQTQKFNQYRYKMNSEVSKKIQQIKSQKNSEIQILKSRNTISIKKQSQACSQLQNSWNNLDNDANQLYESIKLQKKNSSTKGKSAIKLNKNQTLKTIVNKQVKLKQQFNTEECFNIQFASPNKSQKSIGSRGFSQKSFKSIQQSQKMKKIQKQIKQSKLSSVVQNSNLCIEQKISEQQKQNKVLRQSLVKIGLPQNYQSQKSIDLMIKHNNQKIQLNTISDLNSSSYNMMSSSNVSQSRNNPKYVFNNSKNVFKIVPKQFNLQVDQSSELLLHHFETESQKLKLISNLNKSQRVYRNTDKPHFAKKQLIFQAESQTCQASPQKKNKKIRKIPVTKINQFQREKRQRMNTIQQVQNNFCHGNQSNNGSQIQYNKNKSLQTFAKNNKMQVKKTGQKQKAVKFKTSEQQSLLFLNSKSKIQQNQIDQHQLNSRSGKSYYKLSNSVSRRQISTNLNLKKLLLTGTNPIKSMTQQEIAKFKSQIFLKIQKQFNFLCEIGFISLIQAIYQTEKNCLDVVVSQKTQSKLNQKKKQQEQKEPISNQSKTFRTLKAILIQNGGLNNKKKDTSCGNLDKSVQKTRIYNKLAQQLKNTQTFSEITLKDFQLFGITQLGNIEAWQGMKVNEIGLDNKFNVKIKKIQAYFKYLFKIDKFKHRLYSQFVVDPIFWHKKVLKKLQNKDSLQLNAVVSEVQIFCSDKFRSSLYKIFKFHQVAHKSNCDHVQNFLKKIGYYKYSSFYGTRLKLTLQNAL